MRVGTSWTPADVKGLHRLSTQDDRPSPNRGYAGTSVFRRLGVLAPVGFRAAGLPTLDVLRARRVLT